MTWQKTLEELLSKEIGLDSASLGPTLLLRAVHRRMKATEVAREDEYVHKLRYSRDERQELIEELVVSESWFFRDNQPFILLRRHAADWLSSPSSPIFRALSLACATGDEPYSIAITLLDIGIPKDRFVVDAIDISRNALERARRGVYGQRALRSIDHDTALKARFFRPHPDGMEVAPEVRQTVRFSCGNLVHPSTLDVRPPYQAIFCRNLLIYLTDVARDQAVNTLDRLLGPTGLLFVGHAERLTLLETRFMPVRLSGSFAYQRRSNGENASPDPGALLFNPGAGSAFSRGESGSQGWPPGPATTSTWKPQTQTSPPPASPPSWMTPSPPSGPSGRDVSTNGPLEPPAFGTSPVGSQDRFGSSPPPAPAPAATPGFTGGSQDLIEQAESLANRHEYTQAIELCSQSIRLRGPSAPAFYLIGMSWLALRDEPQAEQYLSKAVYLDNQHEEALLTLSMIARRRGDHAGATSYQRRAERARQRKST